MISKEEIAAIRANGRKRSTEWIDDKTCIEYDGTPSPVIERLLDEIEELQEKIRQMQNECVACECAKPTVSFQDGFAQGYDSALKDIERQISQLREEKDHG